jgi:hypothetical protein
LARPGKLAVPRKHHGGASHAHPKPAPSARVRDGPSQTAPKQVSLVRPAHQRNPSNHLTSGTRVPFRCTPKGNPTNGIAFSTEGHRFLVLVKKLFTRKFHFSDDRINDLFSTTPF